MKVKIERVPGTTDFKIVFSGEILGSDIGRLKTEADEEMASALSDAAARPPASYLLMSIAIMFLRSEEKRAKQMAAEAVANARKP